MPLLPHLHLVILIWPSRFSHLERDDFDFALDRIDVRGEGDVVTFAVFHGVWMGDGPAELSRSYTAECAPIEPGASRGKQRRL